MNCSYMTKKINITVLNESIKSRKSVSVLQTNA